MRKSHNELLEELAMQQSHGAGVLSIRIHGGLEKKCEWTTYRQELLDSLRCREQRRSSTRLDGDR